ncbi:MFS transporter [Actinocatenispora rupis]|uniref:Major facilitator superfamily (MFS) profile domain-containing protein n=1 Tax=Actinocatenispora rupis TaxID=519421 RepID=A0A8J3JGF1_9ACTN|nr:MFS transporter [Actinocatenispora rupis]GID15912.1 hypothetical protein Aru02nite_68010 [Actinocatenispora rupis]
MSLVNETTPVTRWLVLIRVVNRLGAFSMGFLGLRLSHDLGAALAVTGAVLAVFGACTIPSRLLGGVLATRFGARPALLTGLVASAAAQTAIALGPSVPVVAVGAVALGLAYEIVEPATQGLVAQSVPPERRAGSYSLLWAALSVAGVAAGAVAAVVSRWSIGALFLVDAGTSLVAAAVVLLRLPAVARTRSRGTWRAAVSGRLLAWTGVGCVSATLLMVVVFMLPLTVAAGGHSPSVTGGLLAVAAAAAIGAQRFVARWERRVAAPVMLLTGYALLTAALLGWAWGTLPALVAGAALEGASGALLLGTQQAVASRMAPPDAAAGVLTVYGLSWGVGTVVAPLVGARLLAAGAPALWLTCAATAAVLALGHGLHHALVRPARVAA